VLHPLLHCAALQGPLAGLAAAVQSAIVEAGKALQAAGQKSLGALILEHLDGLQAAGWVRNESASHHTIAAASSRGCCLVVPELDVLDV
jgi:hypothetical protein